MYVSRVGGGIGCDDASALLPGINAASTGAFAFTDVDMNIWVATTLSIVDLAVHEVNRGQPPRLSQRKRAIEGKSPMESVHSRSPRCLSGERECTSAKMSAFSPNGATDAYRPHPPAIGAE